MSDKVKRPEKYTGTDAECEEGRIYNYLHDLDTEYFVAVMKDYYSKLLHIEAKFTLGEERDVLFYEIDDLAKEIDQAIKEVKEKA